MTEPRTDRNESLGTGPEDEVSRVTAEEVKERLEHGEPIFFIDSRSNDAWSSSDIQIPGAVRIPPDDAAAHLSEVPQNRSVVVYCT